MDKSTVTEALKAIGVPSHTAKLQLPYLALLMTEGELVKADWNGNSAFVVVTDKRLLYFKGIADRQYRAVPLGNVQGFAFSGGGLLGGALQVNLVDGPAITLKARDKAAYPSAAFFTETLNNLLATKKFEAGTITNGKIHAGGRLLEGDDYQAVLIVSLGDKGEKLLADNIDPAEQITIKLKGTFGEGFVVTNKRIYILKWGNQTGHMFGGECTAFELMNVTGLQLNKHMTSGFVEVLSPATQANPKLSYWGDRDKGNNAQQANYAVTFTSREQFLAFQEAVKVGRELINQVHQGPQKQGAPDELDQLEKLAALKARGIITEQEFQAKKKHLLGL